MADELFTLRKMAERICSKEGRPAREVGSVFNQLRGLQQRGLLRETDRKGPTGAARYSAGEFVRGRLLLAAIESGIESRNLDELAAQTTHARSRRTSPIPGDSIDYSFDAFLKSLAHPTAEPWVLRIAIAVEPSSGESIRSARLVPARVAMKPYGDSWLGDPTHPDTKPENRIQGLSAFVKMPATDLVRSLLSDS